MWVCLSVLLWSFLRRQRWTCCQSPLTSHPIFIITIIFILHPLSRASAQFSVPLSPPLSSHPQFPSSTTTWGATTCPLPPPKTQRRRTSLNARDRRAIDGLCESFFVFFAYSSILVMNVRWKETQLSFSFVIYFSAINKAWQFSAFTKQCLSSFFLLSQASHRKSSGFSAVSQLFSERWPSTPANRSFSGPTTERNIDFELDIRVEIDSGKCVLHPTTQQPEHEDISLRRYDERHNSYSDNYCRENRIWFKVWLAFPAVNHFSNNTL